MPETEEAFSYKESAVAISEMCTVHKMLSISTCAVANIIAWLAPSLMPRQICVHPHVNLHLCTHLHFYMQDLYFPTVLWSIQTTLRSSS